jgi:AcrR family transcriptional regulator
MVPRMTGEERRKKVLTAAAEAFAESGYAGTSTEDIAARAGISQPYIFRLFGSKKDLFLAVARNCFERTERMFAEAGREAPPGMALVLMGAAYQRLINDPVLLLVQMQCFTAAVHDADVRRVAQQGMRRIWEVAARESGAGPDALREWLAIGMLLNLVAALGLDQLDEEWASHLVLDKESPCPPGPHEHPHYELPHQKLPPHQHPHL